MYEISHDGGTIYIYIIHRPCIDHGTYCGWLRNPAPVENGGKRPYFVVWVEKPSQIGGAGYPPSTVCHPSLVSGRNPMIFAKYLPTFSQHFFRHPYMLVT